MESCLIHISMIKMVHYLLRAPDKTKVGKEVKMRTWQTKYKIILCFRCLCSTPQLTTKLFFTFSIICYYLWLDLYVLWGIDVICWINCSVCNNICVTYLELVVFVTLCIGLLVMFWTLAMWHVRVISLSHKTIITMLMVMYCTNLYFLK